MVRGFETAFAAPFNILLLIKSGPLALYRFKLLISAECRILPVFEIKLGRIAFSSLTFETEVKKELRVSAISRSV